MTTAMSSEDRYPRWPWSVPRCSPLSLCLLGAAPALAADGRPGRGPYGEADDKVVTNVGFILIGGFPLLILLSAVQHGLDKRKYRRLAAAKARRARADERGGW